MATGIIPFDPIGPTFKVLCACHRKEAVWDEACSVCRCPVTNRFCKVVYDPPPKPIHLRRIKVDVRTYPMADLRRDWKNWLDLLSRKPR